MKNETIIKNEATILLSGFAAEELLLGSCGFTCHNEDRDRAYKMIEDLVFGGFKQKTLAKNVREELKAKAFGILKQCHENAMALLHQHKVSLIAITEELMVKQILTDKEIKTIINTAEDVSKVEDKSTDITTKPDDTEPTTTTEASNVPTTGEVIDQPVTIGNGAERIW
jgi:ATP-dependent Zn protease